MGMCGQKLTELSLERNDVDQHDSSMCAGSEHLTRTEKRIELPRKLSSPVRISLFLFTAAICHTEAD